MSLNGSIVIPVFLGYILMGSCKKFIPFEGENNPPRLVLNGQIEADSVFTVDLAHSLGYIDISEIGGIENGVVNVFLASGEHVETLDHIGEGLYRGSQVAVAGQVYRVAASAPGYPTISAVDVVPPVVPIAGWDTSGTQTDEGGFQRLSLDVSFRINDPAGVGNYYMIEAFHTRMYDLIFLGSDPVTGQELYDTIHYEQPQKFNVGMATTDLVLSSEYDAGIDQTEIHSNRFLFTDELFDGNQRQFQFRTDQHYGDGVLEFQLTSLSADLFRYLRTYERYQSTQGDPFSEPVQVFNNILGGLGIWGGRSGHHVILND